MKNTNKKKEREFVASLTSDITPDLKYIKKHDEIFKKDKGNLLLPLSFLLVSLPFFFIHKLIMAILAVIGLIILIGQLILRSRVTNEFMYEYYAEGLLTSGLIINTSPLTIMVLAELTAFDNCPQRYACFVLKVKQLPETKTALYEKVPCSSMFCYDSGNYHDYFIPHPLCWATNNQAEITGAVNKLEKSYLDNNLDEWEVIKRISQRFPNLKSEEMLLLDENCNPIGKKPYYSSSCETLLTDEIRFQYRKSYPSVHYVTDSIPALDVYNKMLDLALKHQVYEYITVHSAEGGYFTYISNPILFLNTVNERCTLEQDEYPLIIGKMVLTTKGLRNKKQFYSWEEITINTTLSFTDEIRTVINDKKFAQFKCCTDYYENNSNFNENDLKHINILESERLQSFFEELKAYFTSM